MKKTLTILSAGLLSTVAAFAVAGADDKTDNAAKPGRAAFERIKELSGEWVLAKPEDPADADKVYITYRVTSAGSAVIETMMPGDEHEMITMYHMDGDDLVLTHYCAIGNQPHMKLEPDDNPNRLAFEFAGGANIDPAKDTHMHRAVYEFEGDDRFDATWTTWSEGKDAGSHVFQMKRKQK